MIRFTFFSRSTVFISLTTTLSFLNFYSCTSIGISKILKKCPLGYPRTGKRILPQLMVMKHLAAIHRNECFLKPGPPKATWTSRMTIQICLRSKSCMLEIPTHGRIQRKQCSSGRK